MTLPLQPDLHPPGRLRTWATALGLGLCVALAAIILPARTPPPRLVLSGPDAPEQAIRLLERLCEGAQHRLWVMFYVVRADDDGPVHLLMTRLAQAQNRGVEVVVVLDRGHADDGKNQAAAARLATLGLPVVWDETGVTTHAKVVLADDTVWIGSHNGTRSALMLNREAAVILTDAGLAADVARWFHAIPGFPPPRPSLPSAGHTPTTPW